MGQEVQMDEHEGGVRPPLLDSLAQPVCDAGPRQGRRLPVHRVKPPVTWTWTHFKASLCVVSILNGGYFLKFGSSPVFCCTLLVSVM